MKFFAQLTFNLSDGTNFLVSRECESVSDIESWLHDYIDAFSDYSPTFDIFPFDDDLELS